VAPLDAVALTAVSGVAVPLFQSLVDSGGKILGLFGRQIDRATKQTIYTASGEYANRYTRRHGQIKLLGMRQPLDLEAIAVPLRVSIEHEARRFASVEESEQGFAQTGQFAQPSGVVFSALELARQRPYVMVLGTPGSGKTTVLRQVGLEALRGKAGAKVGGNSSGNGTDGGSVSGSIADTNSETSSGLIPVFIELKRFADREFNLREALVHEFEVCGFPEADGFVELALDRGKLLILLDGLDELPTEQRNGAIGQLQDFVDRHNKNRFLCSCRSSVYQYNLKQFVDAVVLPLTPLQVQHFVHQWAIARPIDSPINRQSETSSPRDLDSPEAPVITDVTATQTSPTAIQSEENTTNQTRTADTVTDTITHDPDLTELSRSPLLLTLFSLTDSASLVRLNSRPFLYQEIIELYLRTWSDLKRVPRSPIYPDFGVTLQQQFLGEIALNASRNQQIFLARRGLVEALKSFLQTRLQAPDYLDGDAILDAIVVQQGILTERSRDVFSFDHVALQAYCAATALGDQASNQGLGDREIETIAAQYLGDPLWRSIFPLWVDRLGRRGAVLLHALEKAAKKGQDSGVVAWLAAQDETIAIESVSLDQLRPWRSVLSQGSVAPIAIGLAAMANRIDSVDRIPDRPDGSGDGESSRLGQSFRQLWTVLQTDVLAGVGTREPTAVGWQALALYLVSLETIARCRLMVNTEA
jgi:predicted NACHT family NTPase